MEEKESKKKRKKKFLSKWKELAVWQKIIITIVLVIVLLVLLACATFFIMKATGRSSLMKKALGKPKFTKTMDHSNELSINPDDMSEVSAHGGVYTITEDGESLVTENGVLFTIDEGEAVVSANGESIIHVNGKYIMLEKDEYTVSEDGKTLITQYGTFSITDKGTKAAESAENGENFVESEDGSYDLEYQGVKYKYNTNMINLLVLGIDRVDAVTRAENSVSGGQSDVIMLIAINPDKNIFDVIAIPRDTIAKIDVYNADGSYSRSGYAQICLQHGYGDGMSVSNERAKEAVSELMYGLPIQSCTSVNIGAVSPLNDAIGGVTVTALETFELDDHVFEEGERVTLYGDEAHAYIRYRDTDEHFSAGARLERQKQYLNAFIGQAMGKIRKNPATVVNLYNIINRYVVTDLSSSEMLDVATEVSGCSFNGISTLSGFTSTSMTYERFYADEGALRTLILNKFYNRVD